MMPVGEFPMPTLQEVERQIAALPHTYIFYTRKEIRYLPKILGDHERILAVTSGYMNKHTWLCVCTDKRVIFLDRGMLWGLRQIQMNLDRIQAIDSSYTIFFGRIRVWDGASAIEVGLVLKSSIAPFVRTVQEAMDHYKRQMVHDMVGHATAATTPAHTPSPWLTELERLAQMKDSGQITPEEFTTAKAKLLAK
jgi:hypothetical protein